MLLPRSWISQGSKCTELKGLQSTAKPPGTDPSCTSQGTESLGNTRNLCPPPLDFTESQNPSMAGVGRDLWESPSPTPCRSRVTQSRLHRTASRRILNISREGDSTASLGSLAQCSVTVQQVPSSPSFHGPSARDISLTPWLIHPSSFNATWRTSLNPKRRGISPALSCTLAHCFPLKAGLKPAWRTTAISGQT